MNINLRRLSIITAVFITLSCSNDHATLGKIDLWKWKDDKNGCSGDRTQSIEEFQRHKNELLGLSESEIVKMLGKPDQNELYSRNQKFYYFFLEPASACSVAVEKPRKLVVRFNAVGLAKEVSIQ
jgi:hypothetical protein